MRIGKIIIAGNEYILCFSTLVVKWLEEENNEGFDAALQQMYDEAANGKLSKLFSVLSMMIKAGDIYAKTVGIENPPALSEEDLYILTSPADYKEMFDSVIQSIKNGQKRKIESKPDRKKTAKNQKAIRKS